jgi:hypothetical protein
MLAVIAASSSTALRVVPDTGYLAIRYLVAYLWLFDVIASYLVHANPR